ncbi:hypothetical protein GF373_01160 [bacterium]|nr:hypothetical protein [bacterium]
MRRNITFIIFVFCCLSSIAQGTHGYSFPPTGTIESERISELSGVVPAQGEGEFWGLNDGGDAPNLYRFNDQGELLQTVMIEGAENRDWEAMAKDPQGNIYIADVGDNKKQYESYRIYVVKEPDVNMEQISEYQIVSFKYEDGFSHDCEAVFWMGGKLYLITKGFLPGSSEIFVLDELEVNRVVTARKYGSLTIHVQDILAHIVTDAVYSSAWDRLAVLTYGGVLFYQVNVEEALLKAPAHFSAGVYGQSEALCFDGDDLLVTNEAGYLWLHPVAFYYPSSFISSWEMYGVGN